MEFQNLKDNPEILPTHFQASSHDFIHYYNLTSIGKESNSIIKEYENVTAAIVTELSAPYFDMLYSYNSDKASNIS